MEPWQGHEIHGRVHGKGRQTAGGIAFLVFVGDERDSRGGVEAVGRGRDGRVHRHARRPHGLVPGQAHQDGV